MQYSVEWIEAEFQAKEAAALTGVSPEQQRNWRRRGYLSAHDNPGRVRFSLVDVCMLKVMGILAEAKIAVSFAQFTGLGIAVDVSSRIRSDPAAVEIIGADLTEEETIRLLAHVRDGEAKELAETNEENSSIEPGFTMFRLPDLEEGDPRSSAYVSRNWMGLHEMAEKDGGLSVALVINSTGIAREIVKAATRPLVTIKLTPMEAEK